MRYLHPAHEPFHPPAQPGLALMPAVPGDVGVFLPSSTTEGALIFLQAAITVVLMSPSERPVEKFHPQSQGEHALLFLQVVMSRGEGWSPGQKHHHRVWAGRTGGLWDRLGGQRGLGTEAKHS